MATSPVPPSPQDPNAQAPQQADASNGSPLVGYMGPDDGPYECANCTFFQGSEGPGTCSNPKVQQDPQVLGNVDSEGCCNEFNSAHKESQDEEHSEAGCEEYKPTGAGMDLSAPMKRKPGMPKF